MRALAAVTLLVSLGCSSGVDVRGGAGDPHYDFKNLKTYAWMPSEPTGDPRIDEALLEERVHGGVDEDLMSKGYRPAPAGDAGFLVGYRAVLGRQRSAAGGQKSFEGIWTADHAPVGTGEGTTHDTVTYEGTLVLRIFDGKGKQLVWEAMADTEINPKRSPLSASREEKIRTAIRGMLERFPP